METLSLIRDIIGSLCLLGGAGAIIIGAFGLLRLGDVYQRMHASGVVDTGGAGLILLGLLLLAPDASVAVRLILIGAMLVFTSPTATHAIARAAHAAGEAPKYKKSEAPKYDKAQKNKDEGSKPHG